MNQLKLHSHRDKDTRDHVVKTLNITRMWATNMIYDITEDQKPKISELD